MLERIRWIVEGILNPFRILRRRSMRIEHVFAQNERPLSSIAHAGIAVCTVKPEQQHIGVLHREDASDEAMLLHLAWHHDLRNNRLGPHYLWIEIPVPSPRLRQVAAICRKVWRSNQNVVPYAFSSPNDCFEQSTGRFLLGPTRHGLTCATFVLAVFETAGLSLIQYETWPDYRTGDQQWQESILDLLRERQPPASAEHIAAISSEIGAVRYRPEEVASAATVSELPAAFQAVQPLSERLLDKLAAVAHQGGS